MADLDWVNHYTHYRRKNGMSVEQFVGWMIAYCNCGDNELDWLVNMFSSLPEDEREAEVISQAWVTRREDFH